MDPRLIDVLRGVVPALVLLAVSAVLIHAICRRPPFSRLTRALSLGVFAGCLALFHTLVEGTEWLGPYDLVLGLFALAYTGFIARGRAQVSAGPPGGPGAPRSATCRTLEDSELFILPEEALRPLLVNDPAAAVRLSQAMARRKIEYEEAAPASEPEVPVVTCDLAGFLLGVDLLGGER